LAVQQREEILAVEDKNQWREEISSFVE